jgi:hypothetical protein
MRNLENLTAIVVIAALIGAISLTNARGDEALQKRPVYVAGKGKYCKELSVSGYLDCFYASLEACQKHNNSTNHQCVANPNNNNNGT